MSSDPLLNLSSCGGSRLRNRLMSTAHEPAYTEDGMPKERYRLYHAEKAKGGIALTMIGGSSVVSPDSPQAFGNILLYKDECRAVAGELADDVPRAGRGGDDPDHPSRPPHQLEQGRLAAGHRALDVREPAHRAFPKAMEDWDFARVIAAYADAAERVKAGGLDGVEFECYGHLDRSVLVAGHQQARRRLWRIVDNRLRFGMAVLEAVRRARRPRFPHRRAAASATRIGSGA